MKTFRFIVNFPGGVREVLSHPGHNRQQAMEALSIQIGLPIQQFIAGRPVSKKTAIKSFPDFSNIPQL